MEIYMMLSVIGRLSAAFAQQVACRQVDVPDEVSSASLARLLLMLVLARSKA